MFQVVLVDKMLLFMISSCNFSTLYKNENVLDLFFC